MKSLFLSIFMHWMISHNKFISLETCPILCSTCTYANETIVLGGDFNCALTELDKWGARSMELKKLVTEEINNLIIAHDLIDNWRANNLNLQGFTWSNLSMKIQCRLDYLMISKDMRSSLQTVKIIPNVFLIIPHWVCLYLLKKNKFSRVLVFENSIIHCQLTKIIQNWFLKKYPSLHQNIMR